MKALEDEIRELKGKFLGRSTLIGSEFRLGEEVDKW